MKGKTSFLEPDGLNTSGHLDQTEATLSYFHAPPCRSAHQGLHGLWAALPVAEKMEGCVG